MADVKMEGLRARWERLTERERLLVGAGAVATFLVVLGVVVFLVNSTLNDLREDNAEIRQALKDIEANRDAYVRVRSKVAQVESRIGKGTVQLEGFLESAANASEILISETTERAPQQIKNTKYIERAVDLRVRKCTLEQLSKFLKKIETGPNLVVVTGLHARVRDDKHEDLEVDLTVSTWERAPDKKGGGGDKGGGGGGGGDKAGGGGGGKEGSG